MARNIYAKLAVTNLKNNRKTYMPYILTSMLMVMMFYMFDALTKSKDLRMETLRLCLQYATGVMVIFSVIFLFYTNSFLMKQRKNEIGVYNVLGMGKRHIAKMMAVETVIIAGVSMIGGLILGIIFGKMMYLILLKILHSGVEMKFAVSMAAIKDCLVLFLIIFMLTFIYNLLQVQLANPMELLRGSSQGEKEPKTRWLLALVGVLALGSGYYIALTTKEPLKALLTFFLAVVLVIIGTYALFTAGSIALLKILKKNKKYYYRQGHFTTISGMIYRMKQNAVGLANICILSTMVLVMISTTTSLYAGMEDVLHTRFPKAVAVTNYQTSRESRNQLQEALEKECDRLHLQRQSQISYRCGQLMASQKDEQFEINADAYNSSKICYLTLLPLEDYNHMEGKTETLNENEILLYCPDGKYNYYDLKIAKENFHVKKQIRKLKAEVEKTQSVYGNYYIVFKNTDAILKILQMQNYSGQNVPEAFKKNQQMLRYYTAFDLNGKNAENAKILEKLQKGLNKVPYTEMESRETSRESFYGLYGGLFFIGIYLGILFLIATVLIIYYKQISEGFEDRKRFQIMQNVGMSKREVRRSIRSQILSVFFLPLFMAILHVIVAFPIMVKLLRVLNLSNRSLFAGCTVTTIGVFAVFYAIVYSLTAKEYYRIVN